MKLKKRTHYGYSSAYSGPYGGAYEGTQVGWTPADLGLRAWYDAEVGQPKGVGYVQLDGTSGDYIYTPDAPNLDLAGDIEVVMRVKATDWSTGVNQTLAGKYVTTGNQRSWRFYVGTTGSIVLTASADGTVVTSASITPTVALTDNAWVWLRMRLQLTNGANSVATLDIAADQAEEPTSWTANGTQTAAIIASVFGGTAPLEIGTFANGTLERFSGQVSRCIVRDGFGGRTIADFDARACYGPGYLNQGSLPTDGGGARYVPLRGVSGDYVWTADKAALRVTGDIELVARVALNDWTPSVEATVLAREQAAANRSFRLSVLTDGRLNLTMTSDGSTLSNAAATSAGPWVDNTTYWVKVTRRQSDGRVQHFYAADQATEPTGWTQLGADLTLSSGAAIYSGTSQLEVGSRLAGVTQPLNGRVYRAIVRNGIGGTVVADFNAEQATVFGQAADGYGNGWLIADPKHLGNWTLGLPKIYDRSGNGVAPATFGAGSNQPQWLPWKGVAGVFLTPSSSNRLNTPSSATFDTTDLDVWVDITMPDWSPSGETTIAARKDPSDPNQAWRLTVAGSGAVTLRWYPLGTGASLLSRTSAVNLSQCGVVDGQRVAIRAILDVDNGAGGYTVTMQLRHGGYDGTWVTFDSFTGGATTALPSVNRVLEFGNEGGNGDVIVHRGFLAGSIGGAAVADLVAASCGQSGYTDTLGNVWTVGRATSGRKAVVQSPVAASARSVILHGTDDGIDVPAAAYPNMGVADNFTVGGAIRQYGTPPSFGTYLSRKIVSDGNTAQGVAVFSNGTSLQVAANFGDGTTGVTWAGSVFTSGTHLVLGVALTARTAGQLLVNDVATPVTSGTIGSVGDATLATAGAIGKRSSAASGYQDCEVSAMWTLARAASATEHGQLTAYYRGGL